MACSKSKITSEFLLSKLGNPNKIVKDNLGSIFYEYYFLDGKSLPSEAHVPQRRLFIFFRFDKDKSSLAFIGEDHYD